MPRTFVRKTNGDDTVYADDVNNLQEALEDDDATLTVHGDTLSSHTSELADHEARVTAAEAGIDGLETDIAGKADTTYVTAQLGTKVNTNDVQAVVADAIALDDTVALAAAAAVDDEIAGRDILEAGQIVEDDVIFSVVDEDNRRTWLEVAPDGGLTAHAADKIAEFIVGLDAMDSDITDVAFAVVDADGRRTWLEVDEAGRPTTYALGLISDGLVEPEVTDWAHWGDSLTAAGSSGDWPTVLAGLTGKAHYNGGYGGQGTASIAARQNGVPARVSVSGNSIPTSGAVSVTMLGGHPLNNSGSRTGTIFGIPGTLARDSGGSYTFTRTTSGDATTVYPGAFFLNDAGESYRDRIVTIWAGRNDFETVAAATILTQIQQMIDYLTPSDPKVVVLAVPPSSADSGGDTTLRIALNTALLAAFPRYYLDIVSWLQSSAAATAAGVTFDSNDISDISSGFIPRVFTSDGLHYNSTGGTAIAHRIYHEAQMRGWL